MVYVALTQKLGTQAQVRTWFIVWIASSVVQRQKVNRKRQGENEISYCRIHGTTFFIFSENCHKDSQLQNIDTEHFVWNFLSYLYCTAILWQVTLVCAVFANLLFLIAITRILRRCFRHIFQNFDNLNESHLRVHYKTLQHLEHMRSKSSDNCEDFSANNKSLFCMRWCRHLARLLQWRQQRASFSSWFTRLTYNVWRQLNWTRFDVISYTLALHRKRCPVQVAVTLTTNTEVTYNDNWLHVLYTISTKTGILDASVCKLMYINWMTSSISKNIFAVSVCSCNHKVDNKILLQFESVVWKLH